MYRNTDYSQMTIYDFIHPFGGHLDEENRWVKLHDLIDWDMIDEEYSTNFDNESGGQEAYPAQLAFGSLYIQRRLGYTDRELVEQIRENPYMQYFVGFKEYKNKKPFDASLLVTFRKRFPEETMNRIIEKMFIEHADVTIEKTLKKKMMPDPTKPCLQVTTVPVPAVLKPISWMIKPMVRMIALTSPWLTAARNLPCAGTKEPW